MDRIGCNIATRVSYCKQYFGNVYCRYNSVTTVSPLLMRRNRTESCQNTNCETDKT